MKLEVRITNDAGEVLVGDHLVCNDTDKLIVVFPGYGASRKSGSKILVDVLYREGHNCLVFDFSGCGESEGVLFSKTISDWCHDAKNIMIFAQGLGYKRFGLIGTSAGGTIAVETAASFNVDRMFLRAPASDFKEMRLKKFGLDGLERAREQGFLDFGNFKINYDSYLESLTHTLYDKVNNVSCPVLIIHGNADDIVPLSQSQKLVECFSEATLLVIEGADHSCGVDGDYVESQKALKDWFSVW